KTKSVAEKRSRGLQAPDMNDPKFLGEVGKMSAITPYSLASQVTVTLSVAKDLLEELARRKVVTLVGGNARIRIYQPAAAQPSLSVTIVPSLPRLTTSNRPEIVPSFF